MKISIEIDDDEFKELIEDAVDNYLDNNESLNAIESRYNEIIDGKIEDMFKDFIKRNNLVEKKYNS